MMDRNHMPQALVDQVKRYLNITWTDSDTEAKVIDMMLDAEIALNHKLGAAVDYLAPGQERRLYLAYCSYAWNDCLNEFDAAYRPEIIQIRHKYEVAASIAAKEEEDEE